jgi:hypothetical protein
LEWVTALGFTLHAFHGKLGSESNLGHQRKGVDRVETQYNEITSETVEKRSDVVGYCKWFRLLLEMYTES